MILLIDIGNTQVKVAFGEQDKLSAVSALAYQEFDAWLKALTEPVEEVIFANVADDRFSNLIKSWALSKLIKFTQVHTQSKLFNVTCGYEQPQQMGIDRWLALLGAEHLYPKQNVLVVDCGTATTIDLLDSTGLHHGGWIIPGQYTMQQAVLSTTKRVFAEITDKVDTGFAANTTDNLNNGCWAATVGSVVHGYNLATRHLTKVRVLLTGGQSEKLSQIIPMSSDYHSDLVFYGLLRYRNH